MRILLLLSLISSLIIDAFVGSRHVRELVLLLNDCFDVMNGRWFKDAIHPKTWKKSKTPNKDDQLPTTQQEVENVYKYLK